MHYYSFNIGDYHSHTSRLSPIEDLAYRRLLDLYYLNERPFNGCSTDVAREIGLREHQADVDYVLDKFFENDGDEWINRRADREIKKYQSKIKSAKQAGKASGKARQGKAKERTFNDRSTGVELTNNQEPRTKNHKPKTTVEIPDGISLDAWGEWLTYRKSKGKPVSPAAATKQFKKLLLFDHATQQAIINQSIENDWQGLFDLKEKTDAARPGSHTATNARKPTPAERTAAAREAVRQREIAERQSTVDLVGETQPDVRSHMGIATG